MATVTKLLDYGNSFAILFSDGSRTIADPSTNDFFLARLNTNHVVSIQRYGNHFKILYDNGTSDISYPTTNPNQHIVDGHGVISDDWVWPVHYKSDGVTKWHLGDHFGPRINPVTGLHEIHPGQDINGAGISNWPIVAPSHGFIRGVSVNSSASYGYNVRMSHDDGSGTLCAHMIRKPTVLVGQEVFPNDIVGYVGATGEVTGTHLHYNTQTVYSPSVNANVIDPLVFMANRGAPW